MCTSLRPPFPPFPQVCLEASNHGKLRSELFSLLRHFPDAYVRQPLDTRKPWKLSRSLMQATPSPSPARL